MDFKSLKPAFSEEIQTNNNELSSKQFQDTLYAWFEEKGLLNELRSYLRLQMIKKLKNLTIGKPIDEKQQEFSLTRQAFNLIIAEHLLRERFYYTLSVFSSELPKASQLPAFSNLIESNENENWKFNEDSVLSIVDLLGISKCSSEAINIFENYSKNQNISLLSCIINCKFNCNGSKFIESIPPTTDSNIFEYLNEILSKIRVPPTIINNLTNQVEQTLKNEGKKLELSQKIFEEKTEKFKSEITEKNHQISELSEKLFELKNENKQIKIENKNLNKQVNETKTAQELLKKFELNQVICKQKHCNETCKNNQLLIEQFKTEINKLQQLNQEKSIEIEKYQTQTNLLLTNLQNSQMKIDFLNSYLIQSNQINYVVEQNRNEKINSNNGNSSSSDELTEEVLKQVRARLQELEQESEAIDNKFRKFKMNTNQ